jgi:hypothetical protein|tara:strand:- start:1705 stop:1896 length:192 start_codon:yes stop_codon:yes gene_type:complete
MNIQVEGEDGLYRDSSTGAIINSDRKAFEAVRAARKLSDRRDREITELRAEIEVLKSMIRANM